MRVDAPRLSLGRAHLLASTIAREARRAGIPVKDLTPVGGLRRFAPDMRAVAVLAVAPASRHAHVRKGLTSLPGVVTSTPHPLGGLTLDTERGSVTVHLTDAASAGSAMVWHTGSHAHVARLCGRASDRGLVFDAAQLTRTGVTVSCQTEPELYEQVGLPYIPPELRQGDDEFDAALEGRLPALVYDVHIRGDLHTHSTWSDGRDPIDFMVTAARQIGYEYIAITDHSERAAASRTLAAGDVAHQRAGIVALRARVTNIQILHGIEVDIMPDGSLDFDESLLAGFDLVLASLHDDAGQDGTQLTERYLQAIRHPLVNVITHPANRSPTRWDGYDLDYDRLFEAAAASGTAMEIDGAPAHLDMDGAVARRATAAGVMLTIDSDAHRAEWLARQMRFGTGTARRGWVEPGHVLNTRSVDEVRAFVARKRARG